MKKLLKNKRGMAIESAILFMLLVFMFGLLLTGVAMTSHLRVKVNNTLLSREIEIEQIGENFVNMDNAAFTQYLSKNRKYSIDSENSSYNDMNNKTLTLKRTNNNTTVLKIMVDNGEIISWKYSD